MLKMKGLNGLFDLGVPMSVERGGGTPLARIYFLNNETIGYLKPLTFQMGVICIGTEQKRMDVVCLISFQIMRDAFAIVSSQFPDAISFHLIQFLMLIPDFIVTPLNSAISSSNPVEF